MYAQANTQGEVAKIQPPANNKREKIKLRYLFWNINNSRACGYFGLNPKIKKNLYFYIYTEVISFCVFVLTIITREPLTDLPQILSRITGMYLASLILSGVRWLLCPKFSFQALLGFQATLYFHCPKTGIPRKHSWFKKAV